MILRHLLPMLLCSLPWASADTEVIGFLSRAEEYDSSLDNLVSRWHIMTPSDGEISLQAQIGSEGGWPKTATEACSEPGDGLYSSDTWVVVDWDPQTGLGDAISLMARVSWPAYVPVDFDLQIYTPSSLAAKCELLSRQDGEPDRPLSSRLMTHRKYLHIRVANRGVLSPATNVTTQDNAQVNFILTVERLRSGFFPPSMIGTVVALLMAIPMSALLSSFIFERLARIAKEAGVELQELSASLAKEE